MATSDQHRAVLEVDWLGFSRRATDAVRRVVERYPTAAERGAETGRGEGGDTAYVIDREAEDAIFAELEALGEPVTAISEERGEVQVLGGGPVHVVIDPIDGSLNAKRGLPFPSVSIAVAAGSRMEDVELGYVAEIQSRREWWARRGQGAFEDGERLRALEPGPLEVIGVEAPLPPLVEEYAAAIGSLEARRVRALGSVAVTLCLVAAGRLDAMVTLGPVRSVDSAGGQLVVREAGGAVAFPEGGDETPLALDRRSRVLAARDAQLLARLLATFRTSS
jgi:myo-inositol-1(or 4)-monophosphatase